MQEASSTESSWSPSSSSPVTPAKLDFDASDHLLSLPIPVAQVKVQTVKAGSPIIHTPPCVQVGRDASIIA